VGDTGKKLAWGLPLATIATVFAYFKAPPPSLHPAIGVAMLGFGFVVLITWGDQIIERLGPPVMRLPPLARWALQGAGYLVVAPLVWGELNGGLRWPDDFIRLAIFAPVVWGLLVGWTLFERWKRAREDAG
jgi:hypothetical protein